MLHSMKRLIAAALVTVALSACGVAGSSPTASAGLAGPSWTLVAIDGQEPAGDTDPTLMFDAAGNVSGSAGCNTYTGTATLDGSSISFGPLGSTRMACPDPDVMAQETAFLTALDEVEAFALDSQGRLVLEDGVVLVFEAATPGAS
jgi:putative lipoprotein